MKITIDLDAVVEAQFKHETIRLVSKNKTFDGEYLISRIEPEILAVPSELRVELEVTLMKIRTPQK